MWSNASLASRPPNFFGGGELEGKSAGSALIKPMAYSTETETKVLSKYNPHRPNGIVHSNDYKSRAGQNIIGV